MKSVEILFLSQEAIQALNLANAALTQAIELALVEHADRTVEMPPKPGVHPGYHDGGDGSSWDYLSAG